MAAATGSRQSCRAPYCRNAWRAFALPGTGTVYPHYSRAEPRTKLGISSQPMPTGFSGSHQARAITTTQYRAGRLQPMARYRTSMRKAALLTSLLTFSATGVNAQMLQLGIPTTSAKIAALDTDVSPDGRGLPIGHGSVREGAALFAERCAMCHGEAGVGQPAD